MTDTSAPANRPDPFWKGWTYAEAIAVVGGEDSDTVRTISAMYEGHIEDCFAYDLPEPEWEGYFLSCLDIFRTVSGLEGEVAHLNAVPPEPGALHVEAAHLNQPQDDRLSLDQALTTASIPSEDLHLPPAPDADTRQSGDGKLRYDEAMAVLGDHHIVDQLDEEYDRYLDWFDDTNDDGDGVGGQPMGWEEFFVEHLDIQRTAGVLDGDAAHLNRAPADVDLHIHGVHHNTSASTGDADGGAPGRERIGEHEVVAGELSPAQAAALVPEWAALLPGAGLYPDPRVLTHDHALTDEDGL